MRMHNSARFPGEHRSEFAQHGHESQSSGRHVGLADNPVLGCASHQLPSTVAFQCGNSAVPPLIAQERRQFQQGSLRPVEAPGAGELNRHRRAAGVAPNVFVLHHSLISRVVRQLRRS
jgi:hypothetical protein